MRKINLIEEIKKKYPYIIDILESKEPKSHWNNKLNRQTIELWLIKHNLMRVGLLVTKDSIKVTDYECLSRNQCIYKFSKESFLYILKEINKVTELESSGGAE